MKFKDKKLTILLFALFVAFATGFSACNADSEDVIIPKTLEEYKMELSEMVASEKAVVEKCIVGYNKGDFRGNTYYADYTYNYMAALVQAEAILAKTDLTIDNIMAANKLISSPGKAFNDNVFISDRRPLHELIVVCDTLYARTPTGTDPGMAPAEAKNQFKTDISAAKSVRDRSTTIDRQVTEAVDELNADLLTFQKAVIK